MDKATCERDMSKKPSMRIKVPFWQGKWEGVEIYDADRNCIFPCSDPNVSPMEIITKLSHMKTMIQCGGIWFASGKFGVTWKLHQAKVKPPDTFQKGKCYVSMGSEMKTPKADAYDSDGESEPLPVPLERPVLVRSETSIAPEPVTVAEPVVEPSQDADAEPPKEETNEEPVSKPAKKTTKTTKK